MKIDKQLYEMVLMILLFLIMLGIIGGIIYGLRNVIKNKQEKISLIMNKRNKTIKEIIKAKQEKEEEEIRMKQKEEKDEQDKIDKYWSSKFRYLGEGSCIRPMEPYPWTPLSFSTWSINELNDCKEECYKNKKWCLGIERRKSANNIKCNLIANKRLFEENEGPVNTEWGSKTKIDGQHWTTYCQGDCNGTWERRAYPMGSYDKEKAECYELRR